MESFEDWFHIRTTFDNYENVEKYAEVIEIDTIKENDYNLNISRYVDTTEPEPEVDIEAVIKEIKIYVNKCLFRQDSKKIFPYILYYYGWVKRAYLYPYSKNRRDISWTI